MSGNQKAAPASGTAWELLAELVGAALLTIFVFGSLEIYNVSRGVVFTSSSPSTIAGLFTLLSAPQPMSILTYAFVVAIGIFLVYSITTAAIGKQPYLMPHIASVYIAYKYGDCAAIQYITLLLTLVTQFIGNLVGAYILLGFAGGSLMQLPMYVVGGITDASVIRVILNITFGALVLVLFLYSLVKAKQTQTVKASSLSSYFFPIAIALFYFFYIIFTNGAAFTSLDPLREGSYCIAAMSTSGSRECSGGLGVGGIYVISFLLNISFLIVTQVIGSVVGGCVQQS